ncbi:MAG: hypothetical protein RH862_03705 [Leptospiraceae bacterium]
MDGKRIPRFDPDLFMEREQALQTDEVIRGFAERTWKLRPEITEHSEFYQQQNSNYSMEQIWQKMKNTLRVFRYFISPDESTSFPALEKASVLDPVLDSSFLPILNQWQDFLNSGNLESSLEGFECEPIPGGSARVFLQIYLYGYGLHSNSNDADMESISEHITDKNCYLLIQILNEALALISKAAVRIKENRHRFS